MKLHAKVLPEYFNMLDYKTKEFRQIEAITLENSETGECRSFKVRNIRKMPDADANSVMEAYSKVNWDDQLPIYVIELGDEIAQKEDSVQVSERCSKIQEDRKFEIPGAEKTWHGVGD